MSNFADDLQEAYTEGYEQGKKDAAVHGRWINGVIHVGWDKNEPNCPHGSCYCSACGEWLVASDEYPVIGNYCPNCGAKMREQDE